LAGDRWPPEVILTAVRRYLGHPLSATSVMVFLAERGIDVSQRTVLRRVQTFGPLLAAGVRKRRRRPGRTWYVDEVCFRGTVAAPGVAPTTVVSDPHQPYLQAVRAVLPEATHGRTGLHLAHGEATKPIERSHVFARDRLCAARGVTSLATGQRCFEGFEALHALRRAAACGLAGRVAWRLAPDPPPCPLHA
jgi:transposase-like protein